MKRVIAIVLALALAAGLSFSFASAEESEYTNYLTHKWEATFFPGKLTEKEEDGDIVTTYIPNAPATWFSPQLSVWDDLRKLAEGSEYINAVFYVEVRGVFDEADSENTIKFLLRGIDPHSNGYSFKAEDMDNWNDTGYTWNELYDDLIGEGSLYFEQDSGINVMSYVNPGNVEINGEDWTVFESDPILISSALLNSDLFSDIILCMDFLPNGFTGGFNGIQIKNTAIYDADQFAGAVAPTAEPANPAETDNPVKATEKPAENTEKPAEATEKPAESTEKPSKNKGCGGAVLSCAAPLLIAAAAFVFRKKRK